MAKPFTDKQKDFLFDYMLEFFKERELNEKEEGFPRKPRDPEGAVIYEAKSNNAFMDMIGKALKDTASEGIKGVPTKEDLEKAKSLTPKEGIKGVPTKEDLEKAKSLTPKEGILTAQQYEQGGDLNYVIEMMKNETDPDKLEELKSIIREMLGTTPYMSIRQDPTRKASEGGDAKEENPLRQFRDDYEMLIGFPNKVLREETKVMMDLLDSDVFEKAKDKEEFKKVFYNEYAPTMKFLDSLPEEERKKALDIIFSKRAEREIDRAEAEGVESLMSRGMAIREKSE